MEGTGSIFSLEGGGDLEETEEEEVLGFCKLNSLPRLSNFHRQNQPKGEAEITVPESRPIQSAMESSQRVGNFFYREISSTNPMLIFSYHLEF